MTVISDVAFTVLQSAVAKQFKKMSTGKLFSVALDKALLWETYLASFPPGLNPIYKVRTEHDCSCCRQFVKTLGGVVSVVDGKIITLWDFVVDGDYQVVADTMAAFVRECVIENVFLHTESLVGTVKNLQLLDSSRVKEWTHFHVHLPTVAVCGGSEIGPRLGESRATFDVMKRGLSEITPDAVDTALDLIAQGSLYRGEEHKAAVVEFKKMQARFKVAPDADLFVWENLTPSARTRNTVIGTLLVDLSEGKDLEDAVKSFEAKVAPTNYKRPTALVTKAMILKAQGTVTELGLTTALERRYAHLDDITVNNILFADRATKKAMNVFEDLADSASVDVKKLGKVEEVSIGDFLSKIVPTSQSIDVLLENRHAGNLVSLVAPVDPTAKSLFKWPNHFSWSYVGDMADSIKERVKQAGGSVTGDFRASLAWFNHDDLDIHLRLPNGVDVGFQNKVDRTTGANLDVDMNAGSGTSRTPVENITFPTRAKMAEGEYSLYVTQYNQRETKDIGFDVEMEFDGTLHAFSHSTIVKGNVVVCKFRYSHKEGLTIIESLPSKQTSKVLWGLPTQTFQKVRVLMHSPNHWDGNGVGNKHYFFMLEGCVSEDTARGFFNEFLGESLTPHRKVLEMVGAKMKTESSAAQLSGLGFSSTQKNHILCRVAGSFTRTIKVLF